MLEQAQDKEREETERGGDRDGGEEYRHIMSIDVTISSHEPTHPVGVIKKK